ncbi:unnamed protein product [Darwinula stevensoni]|uniref:Uncharacterized protein n=1 Tax=Darwinula stevensoni TaxID=69355 RepID=A0A7R9A3V4_9CRUS|nr:unnamed protein product [Darwinula stevensoni]CAG0882125.1 unnamed protein product [Darwinula stevensoni]
MSGGDRVASIWAPYTWWKSSESQDPVDTESKARQDLLHAADDVLGKADSCKAAARVVEKKTLAYQSEYIIAKAKDLVKATDEVHHKAKSVKDDVSSLNFWLSQWSSGKIIMAENDAKRVPSKCSGWFTSIEPNDDEDKGKKSTWSSWLLWLIFQSKTLKEPETAQLEVQGKSKQEGIEKEIDVQVDKNILPDKNALSMEELLKHIQPISWYEGLWSSLEFLKNKALRPELEEIIACPHHQPSKADKVDMLPYVLPGFHACIGLMRGVFRPITDLLYQEIPDASPLTAHSPPVPIHTLGGTKVFHVNKTEKASQELNIFCYHGIGSRSPQYIFTTISARVEMINASKLYDIYYGPDEAAVYQDYQEAKSGWLLSLLRFPVRSTLFKPGLLYVDNFQKTCIGIETKDAYLLSLVKQIIDPWRVILLGAGMVMFLKAGQLSESNAVYYGTGVCFGIMTSLLLLSLICSRVVPRKPVAVGLLLGGWSLSVYIFRIFFDNFYHLVTQYRNWLLGYAIITGVLTFGFLYRFQPLSSLIGVFYSSQMQEFSFLVVVGLLIFYNFPTRWINYIRALWNSTFPVRPRLLTQQEYIDQGVRETKKGLDELRNYCKSPTSTPWKQVQRLSNPKRCPCLSVSPRFRCRSSRFAEFVEGGSDISDDELLDYNHSDVSLPSDTLASGGEDDELTDIDDDDDMAERLVADEREERSNHHAKFTGRHRPPLRTLSPPIFSPS